MTGQEGMLMADDPACTADKGVLCATSQECLIIK
jgi:hypothetical protein